MNWVTTLINHFFIRMRNCIIRFLFLFSVHIISSFQGYVYNDEQVEMSMSDEEISGLLHSETGNGMHVDNFMEFNSSNFPNGLN